MSSSWYTDHPVVSTVLWLMGSPTSLDEEEEQKPTRCLSWKDEHDGGPIAEYMSAPKSPQIGVNFSNVEEPANSSMSRKQSLPALPRNDSDVDNYVEGKDGDDDLMSPQWGWYVSTTPPQEQYGRTTTHSHRSLIR